MLGMCNDELALSILLCIKIQFKTVRRGGGLKYIADLQRCAEYPLAATLVKVLFFWGDVPAMMLVCEFSTGAPYTSAVAMPHSSLIPLSISLLQPLFYSFYIQDSG